MGELTQIALILESVQFVGYWGYGSPSVLKEQLDQVSGSRLHLLGSSVYESSQGICPLYGIALESRHSLDSSISNASKAASNIEIVASVAGLEESRSSNSLNWDARVTLQVDCLSLERDSFGRFPLYWMQQGQVIWFTSHVQLLVPLLKNPTLDLSGLYGYTCFSYVPTPLTPIAPISSIPAGTQQTWTVHNAAAELRAPTCQRRGEWQEQHSELHDEITAIAQLQTLLKNSVQEQMADLTDAPVGVFLSGGLDSSIIAALLVQAGVHVHAYTLNFGDAQTSEVPYAEQVAEFLNIPLTIVNASPKAIRSALLATAQALDIPFGDSVTVPLFLLAQAARQDVSIVFNGEGGDQLFAGWTNKPLIAAGVYQPEHPLEESFTQQYLRTFHRLWGYEAQLFQPEVYSQIQFLDPQVWLQDALNSQYCKSLLHRLRRATLMLKGAQNIHPRTTHIGIANGLKVRSPFCYLPLTEWAFHLSSDLYLRGSCEKYILKRAVESWLPPEIVWRTKRGMGVPITAWCLEALWRDVGIWLNPNRLRQGGIWNPNIAAQIAVGNFGTLQGRRIGESLWLMMMWQVWQHTVFGEVQPTYSFDHPFWLPSWLGRSYLRLRKGFDQW